MTCGRELGYVCSDNPSLSDPGCGEHFGSLRAFDRHLVGAERACMTQASMQRAGLRLNSRGVWTDAAPMTVGRQLEFGAKRGGPRTPRPSKRVATRKLRKRRSGTGDRSTDSNASLAMTSQESA